MVSNTLLNLFPLCPILLAITSVSLGFIRLTELLRFSFRLYPKGFELSNDYLPKTIREADDW